jgi:hypothetical protein
MASALGTLLSPLWMAHTPGGSKSKEKGTQCEAIGSTHASREG